MKGHHNGVLSLIYYAFLVIMVSATLIKPAMLAAFSNILNILKG